jgi:metal-responsive CopG/Arc/MetJ family transcriptional regulator
VKTAISVPDDTFERAERGAASLGMSRSEFFTRAAQRYLDQLDAESLTGRIDAALALAEADGSTSAAVTAGRRRLAAGADDDW